MTNDTTEAEPTVDDDPTDDDTSGDEGGRKQARAQAPNRVEAKSTPEPSRDGRETVQPGVDGGDEDESGEIDDASAEETSDASTSETSDKRETSPQETEEHSEETEDVDEETPTESEEEADSDEVEASSSDDDEADETRAPLTDDELQLIETIHEETDSLEIESMGTEWLHGLAEHMHLDLDVEVHREDDRLHFDIGGGDAERLLGFGKLGPKALEGVETVLERVFADHPESEDIYLDVGGARRERKTMLQNVAVDMADKAVTLGKTLTVSGLNSTERRIIHRELRDYDGVDTESVGSGIFRRLKIEPT